MKKIIILLFLTILSVEANAQDFKKDGNYVTVGYGLDVNVLGLPGAYRGIGLGPVLATYERGITDVLGIGRIGVGGGIGFTRYNYSNKGNTLFSTYEDEYKVNRITPFIRATYHFEFDIPKLDVYAGIGAGLNIDSRKEKAYINGVLTTDDKDIKARPTHFIVAGVRYYFSDFFGVYLAVGDGVSNINGGVVFSF